MIIIKSRRFYNVVNEFRHNKQAIFSLVYLIFIILVSCFAFLIPVDPNAIDVQAMLQGPSAAHWFGTDQVGRDYLVRAIYGGRVSLTVGFFAMLTSVGIGVAVGTTAGYLGGHIDNFLMRFIDIISSIPSLILVMVISLFMKGGVLSLIIVIGLLSWTDIARLVRAETLSVKEREYVQYSDFIGEPSYRIIMKHVIPSVLPTIITSATANMAGAIMMESSLSFLGLGIKQPMSSWGSLLHDAQSNLQSAPYMAFLPGLLIAMTVFSFNKLGDVLRVFVEPKVAGADIEEKEKRTDNKKRIDNEKRTDKEDPLKKKIAERSIK